MRELIFIHGRSQHDQDMAILKQKWIRALKKGLQKSKLELPVTDEQIRFPYYGNTLKDLMDEIATDRIAEIIVKGAEDDADEKAFVENFVLEVQNEYGISEAEIRAVAGQQVIDKGPQNWEWLQAVLAVIDQRVPGASGAAVAWMTKDVYRYLRNPGIQNVIDTGVLKAFNPAVEYVVVSHSLGTVVAYNLLRREGKALGWKVPLFVTLGSPLAVNVIKTALAPIGHPTCVAKWLNAMDERDVVALYALDEHHFKISLAIENHKEVDNHTDNRHGIAGYLDDALVSKRIHDALLPDQHLVGT